MEPHQQSRSQSRSQPREPGLSEAPYQASSPLKLNGMVPGDFTHLERDQDGHVWLHFRGLRFDADDFVPISLTGKYRKPSDTAGHYVCQQMLTSFGYREECWPELARRFLLQHASVRNGDATRAR